MNKRKIIILILSILAIYLIFFRSIFKEEVKFLGKYNFDKGNWMLMKGLSGDSTQYIITDKSILKKLKEKWILYKSEENFATTGGYCIELYKENKKVMFTDIINDGFTTLPFSGQLYHSDYNTLDFNNLFWINDYSNYWRKIKLINKQFDNKIAEKAYLKKLKKSHNYKILDEHKSGQTYYLTIYY